MKKFLVVAAVVLLGTSLFGCGKKAEESQEPVSMEAMSTVNVTTPAALPEAKVQSAPAMATPAVEPGKVEAAAPAFGKPTPLQIQAALKNAGLYTGEVDGKLGPKTKKAIQEFQKANGLKADGKVGPKTWELLKMHLAAPVESVKR
ncbi:MAG: peptidoglycan-binding domain-containing protein [Candidatus Omnitrophica bacterium]|nr:peptidoglycan-binding domain-containing protein [Candidatus Omnitrophota bacterium]